MLFKEGQNGLVMPVEPEQPKVIHHTKYIGSVLTNKESIELTQKSLRLFRQATRLDYGSAGGVFATEADKANLALYKSLHDLISTALLGKVEEYEVYC